MNKIKFSRTLLVAALALTIMLSVTGGTIAWFTDEVTSANNIIKSGNLDVEMYWADGKVAVPEAESSEWKDASAGYLFNYDLWEPGYTEVRHVKIENKGTLALKYDLKIVPNGEVSELADVIDVYYMDPADQVSSRSELTNDMKLGTLSQIISSNESEQNTAAGRLLPEESHTVTIALKMQETAGNEYQNKAIGSDFALVLRATQDMVEEDSFDEKYDEGTAYPDLITTAEQLEEAVKAGGNVKLAKNIELTKSIYLENANFVLDGNGHTITMAENGTNTYALFDITGGKATIKNVTFDGIKGGAVVRTVGAEFNLDNVTAQNGNHTQVQGLFRLLGKSTITNCTFKNNTCNMVITLNYDSDNNDPQVVKNCVFDGNVCKETAVLYYVKGAGCTVDGNKFVGNTVTSASNAATVYMGFTEDNVITNNVFKDNQVTTTGTSKRVSGGLMVGYAATITNNAFVGNTVTGTNATGNDVCASVYYTDIDLSGNYWGDKAPVENDDYFVEYPDNNNVIINDYLTSYEM